MGTTSAFKLLNASDTKSGNKETVLEADIKDDNDEVIINQINNDTCNVYIRCKIFNKHLMAMVDTGSVKNCMSFKFYQLISDSAALNPIQHGLKFMTATGSPISLYGNSRITIEIKGNKCPTNVTICDINECLIIGNEFLQANNAVINYKFLRIEGDNFNTELYKTSRDDRKSDVVTLIDKTVSNDGLLTCKLADSSLQTPGTYLYTPNNEIWGANIRPIVVNTLDPCLLYTSPSPRD